MDLILVYNKVDLQTKIDIISELLQRNFEHMGKCYDCYKIHVKNLNDFPIIEHKIINHFDMLRDDCLLMTKDLFAYLKTVPFYDGIYLITKYHVPILEVKIGKPGTIVDSIEITDYIKKIDKHQSTISWLCQLLEW